MPDFDNALAQWDEGQRRLADAPEDEQRMLERVTQAIQAELRRRLGGAFTVDELVDLYEQGTDWTTDIAVSVAPGRPVRAGTSARSPTRPSAATCAARPTTPAGAGCAASS